MSAPPPDADPEARALLAYLYGHTYHAPTLRVALDWERVNPGVAWRWSDVRALPRDLNRMVLDGVLDRTASGYRVTRHDALSRAMGRFIFERASAAATAPRPPGAEPPVPPGIPADIFAPIIGYADIKRQLLLALGARTRVHVLLIGPPSTSKSIFLECLEKLPGAVYRFGDQVSRSGIRELLFNEHPEYLIIDELDKMEQKDSTILQEVLERGTVSVLHYSENRQQAAPVRVFAAANRVNQIRPELMSRFERIRLREYTIDEFREVARNYLERRGAEPALARMIADGVAVKTRDIRDARRIGDMSYTPQDVQFLLSRLGQEASV